MGEALKPCPFCGGEASIIGKPHEAKFCVGCGDDTCLGFSGLGWLYGTEEEAATAWNRRAERTCRVECSYVIVDDYDVMKCSECDAEFPVFEYPSYCPNCSARVVTDHADR